VTTVAGRMTRRPRTGRGALTNRPCASPHVRTGDRDGRAVDIGAPVRDAVTAAFAGLLPEPLRDALELDRHHLHEIRKNLFRQDQLLFDRLVNLPRPDPEPPPTTAPASSSGE
jgi:hypothetical protein